MLLFAHMRLSLASTLLAMSARAGFYIFGMLFLLASTNGCFVGDYLGRAKQVRTSADMQVICARLDRLQAEGKEAPSMSRVDAIVNAVGGGRDAWGNHFQYYSRPRKDGFSYALISYGSDGRTDVSSPDEYFRLREELIHGQTFRDIVFRDGRSITKAGK